MTKTTMTTRLRELLGKATKGPWVVERYSNYIGWSVYAGDRGCIAERWYDTKQKAPYADELEANAALIVEAVNTLPALLDALDEARGALEDAEGYSFGNASEKEHAKRREALSKINEVMK